MAIITKRIKQLDAVTTVPSDADLIINISTGDSKRTSVENLADSINTTFTGTTAEWEALSSSEKAKYLIVNLTDDSSSGGGSPVDTVEDGNMNSVTSNAVYNYIDTMITQAISASY